MIEKFGGEQLYLVHVKESEKIENENGERWKLGRELELIPCLVSSKK